MSRPFDVDMPIRAQADWAELATRIRGVQARFAVAGVTREVTARAHVLAHDLEFPSELQQLGDGVRLAIQGGAPYDGDNCMHPEGACKVTPDGFATWCTVCWRVRPAGETTWKQPTRLAP